MNKGLLVIISSPSGGGKDSVINALLKIFFNSSRLVTTTTRPMRPGNVEGVDYYFITKSEFEGKIKSGNFLEYNNYAGNYYGIEKARLDIALAENDMVFSQIEVNGKHHLDEAKIDNLSIFLLPESLEILAERIRKRGGVSEEKLIERLIVAKEEIERSKDYDFRIVNEDGKFAETVAKISEIIQTKLTK